MEILDNSEEARERRRTAWQHVLPKVVKTIIERPGMSRDDFLDGLDNVTDLNANVFPIKPEDTVA